MKRKSLIYYCSCLLLTGLLACKKENARPVEEPVFSTFQEMETDLPYQYYLQASFMNDSTGLVVGAEGALMKTVNGGKNWVSVNSHTDFTLYDIQFMNGSIGYVLGYNDEKKGIILKTGNAGDSWEIFRQFDGMKRAAISFPDAKTGYILLDEKRLLKTLDSGATWSEITVNIASANKMGFRDPMYGFITSVDGFYYETMDGGHTWNRFKESTSEDLQQIYFQGDEVILKSDTRLYYKSLSSNRNSDVLPIPSSGMLEFSNDGKGVAIGGRTGPNGLKPTTYVYATIDQLKTWPEKRPDAGIMTLSKLGTNKFLMIGNRSGKTLIFTLEF